MSGQQNQTVMNHFMTEDNTINVLSGDNASGIHVYINSLKQYYYGYEGFLIITKISIPLQGSLA